MSETRELANHWSGITPENAHYPLTILPEEIAQLAKGYLEMEHRVKIYEKALEAISENEINGFIPKWCSYEFSADEQTIQGMMGCAAAALGDDND